MLSAFANSFKIPELRKRILFTFGLIFVSRLVNSVPVPGVDGHALQMLFERMRNQVEGNFAVWFDLFSGGALAQCAVGALSIWPYITAQIVLQLMTAVVPALGKMMREEGESGRQKFNQYTRYLTLVICVVQGFFLAVGLENAQQLGLGDVALVANPGWGFRMMTVAAMTSGTMLLMWLGEQITDRGIGNGISMIIAVNIASRIPDAIGQGISMFGAAGGGKFNVFHLIGFTGLIFAVTAATIALTQGVRKVPIHTAKRVVANKTYGGQSTYMPLRVNYAGVMPIIFAGALLAFPIMFLNRLPQEWTWAHEIGSRLTYGEPMYLLVYGVMILFFSYFWVATQFNPPQIADDLKRNSSYVPGIRPGTPTAEFLDKSMTRITLIGALALTVIAVMPMLMTNAFSVPSLIASFMGGTSLLIVVGVMLDTMRQIESHLLMRHYDGFLSKGHLRGRR
jgi:preprotein translocase subunit SecY